MANIVYVFEKGVDYRDRFIEIYIEEKYWFWKNGVRERWLVAH